MYTDAEYQAMAIVAIRNYLNCDFTDEEITIKYPIAITRFIANSKVLINKPIGISSMSENGASISYKNNAEFANITDDVKALLPRPFLRIK